MLTAPTAPTALTVRTLAPGPAGHGVLRHADAVASAVAGHGVRTVPGGPADLTHAQFTDSLWGPDIASAAAAFVAAAGAVPRPLVVTLHDLPGADPDPARDARRAAGYRRVIAAADAVLVSAGHERVKARALGAAAPHLVPLPLPPVAVAGTAPDWAAHPTLGVLGFVYPGKGHDDVIAAAAAHPVRPAVVAAGAVADGHAGLAAALARSARGAGVRWIVTGALDPAGLAAAAAAVTVPVAPGRTVSASGSLLAWLGHGRVPLAAAGAYACEVAAAVPDALRCYDGHAGRDTLVAAALADPSLTRGPVPAWPQAGPAHAALYRALACGVPA
ncbi:hypothetical protein [Pseudonocardia sp. HH130630-07]|uniref:hypothetical protein n=1 Tax=Pseudonocardia sp. HH130630-07 TaxID=1690815 RepID=UPI000814E4BE|nr:hypothetical protein [Pseudonocardia sp. HH130630-07]ANY08884.1 hypothetical protein AFB00_24425 [Pseudonocardia sp. HH130630-07]